MAVDQANVAHRYPCVRREIVNACSEDPRIVDSRLDLTFEEKGKRREERALDGGTGIQ